MSGREPPFSYDTLLKAYQYMFKYGMLMGVIPLAAMVRSDGLVSSKDKAGGIHALLNRGKCLIEDFQAMSSQKK